MKVNVLVKPNSKTESVNLLEDGVLVVRVNAPPVEGQANARVIELLSEYFGKPKSCIELIRGNSGKKKVFEVL
jgi:uncharacterized protein (TIGR00251 family)